MKENEFLKRVIETNIADKEKIRQRALSSQNIQTKRRFTMKKGLAIAASVIIVAVAVLTAMISVYNTPKDYNGSPKLTKSYADIYDVIESFRKSENAFNLSDLFRFSARKGSLNDNAVMPPPSPAEFADENAAEGGYSKTNIQTEGLDEGDIVKTDGNYIYKLNTKGCFIISANNGALTVVKSIEIENYVPQEMYISGNKLILLGGIYNYYYYNGGNKAEPLMDCMRYIGYEKTDIRIYDIAEVSAPVLERHITLDGTYNTSRLKLEDNKLFYMTNYYFYYGQEEDYIPKIKDSALNGGEETTIPAENIYYYDDIVNYSYMIIGEIDLDTPDTGSKLGAYLGLGGVIYVSAENIFVATYDYQSIYKVNIFGWVTENGGVPKTRIVKIGLSDLTQKAIGRVEGSVKDRYSLDEYNGYLRVATTANASYVFVLGQDLKVVGKIENIAPGETIYSVRFNKETGSLVTFRRMDPYYNLDLSDPANPRISQGLKEDGVSYYLHYIGDTAYTIGVGMMSEVVNDQWGEWVRWTGLKVSLYDNSSGEAVNIKTVVLEGSCYSELFYNPKALLYDEDKGLFAFSYEKWTYDYYYYYSSMEQGLAVFYFDVDAEDAEDKLVYRRTLSNTEEIDVKNSGYYYNYWSFITRGIRIGNYIYTISDQYIKSYNLTTLDKVSELNLYSVIE